MEEIIIIPILTVLVLYSVLTSYLTVRFYKAGSKALNTVEKQGIYIKSISDIINSSKEDLQRLDKLGAFESDDEAGRFFESMKEVQDILNVFILEKDGEEED